MARTPGKPGPKAKHTTPAKRARFLQALVKLGSKTAAAGAIGASAKAFESLEARDPEFAEKVAEALAQHNADLTGHALAIATQGVPEPIFDRNGNQIGEKRKIPTALLLRALERIDNGGEWRNRQKVDHSHGGTIQHEARVALDTLNPEQQRAARAFLASLQDEQQKALGDGGSDTVEAEFTVTGEDGVDEAMAGEDEDHGSE